jgi:cell division protein FtsL
MPQKTVEIDFKKISQQMKQKINQAQTWLDNFFKTMTDYEKLAVGAVVLGFVMLMIGIIIV